MPNLRTAYLIASGLAFALSAYLFYPSAATLDARWDTNHEAYSHGYYILLATILLVIRQWRHFKLSDFSPYPPALLALICGCLAWLVAHIGNIRIGEQLMLPFIALCLVYLLAGKFIGQRLTFPILILYTVIPVWDVLNPPLQHITTMVSSSALNLFGVAVYIQGNHISIPAGNFVVASGCSGLNYLLMCVFLSLIYGHLYLHNLKRQLLMLAAGILTGVICNWVRVTSIIAIGQITEMQSSVINDHENLGLVVFGIFTIPLMLFGRYLEIKKDVKKTDARHLAPQSPRWLAWPILAVCLVFTTHQWNNNSLDSHDIKAVTASVYKNLLNSGLVSASASPWAPRIADADINLNLQQPGLANQQVLNISIRGFLYETQGKELIYEDNRLYPESWFKTDATQALTANGNQVEIVTLKHRRTGKQVLSVYSYLIGDHTTSNAQWVKPLQIYQTLLQKREAALISISQSCDKICTGEISQLLAMTDSIIDGYQSGLNSAL